MFRDKVVVITGGAGGIGKCIREEFEKAGAKVCIIDIADNPYFVGDIGDEATLRRFNGVVTLYTAAEEIIRIVSEVCQQPAEHNLAESHELSERERDVLVLVAKGFTNKEIASELNISPHTVMSHRKNIVHKTGIRSVAGLTVYAVLNKLIDSEQL